ncbi:hypothetical protein M885DRAFT_616004 [Pelagophyceae sp. CCMP2097]|nr:hypothetical protein M885DRAFT_616004 [Pelagophyceae sp. CCMP2097]
MAESLAPSFTEFRTAKGAVLDEFPGANVKPNCIDSYPIKVTIDMSTPDGRVEVWSGDQKGLFSKNGRRAVPTIKLALQMLKK